MHFTTNAKDACLHFPLLLWILQPVSAQVCCPVAAANTVRTHFPVNILAILPFWLNCLPPQANIIILNTRLEALNARHDLEMEWRNAEEKCANQLLQDQINEIQVHSNTC